jgi:MFS family permease
MYGYGVSQPQDDQTFFKITHSIPFFNSEAYGELFGFYYTILYAPALLVIGNLTDISNRKNLLGCACIAWGIISILHAYAKSMSTLYFLRALLGFTQALTGPATYSLIGDLFEETHAIHAFFVFSLLQ